LYKTTTKCCKNHLQRSTDPSLSAKENVTIAIRKTNPVSIQYLLPTGWVAIGIFAGLIYRQGK
ncbi:MAG: hypothetical protein LPD71_12740, partial [Shewanella sp.]|nr:hypothetical protein [Shewanella sp.]